MTDHDEELQAIEVLVPFPVGLIAIRGQAALEREMETRVWSAAEEQAKKRGVQLDGDPEISLDTLDGEPSGIRWRWGIRPGTVTRLKLMADSGIGDRRRLRLCASCGGPGSVVCVACDSTFCSAHALNPEAGFQTCPSCGAHWWPPEIETATAEATAVSRTSGIAPERGHDTEREAQ